MDLKDKYFIWFCFSAPIFGWNLLGCLILNALTQFSIHSITGIFQPIFMLGFIVLFTAFWNIPVLYVGKIIFELLLEQWFIDFGVEKEK